MVQIRPFRGTYYDTDKAGAYDGLVAPPYDIITPEMREELHARSEYNIVRLILGREDPRDTVTDNKYTRAGKCLQEWLDEGVLRTDDEPCLYVYAQDYEHHARKWRRVGIISLVRIDEDDENCVVPHEHTLDKPRADRLDLIKEVEANLSPIFAVFDDSDTAVIPEIAGAVEGVTPMVDISSRSGRERLWRISDPGIIESVAKRMEKKRLFIADGHHRYEVARTYRQLRRKDNDYRGEADHTMIYMTDMSRSDNLTVMATHRAIRDEAWQGESPLMEEKLRMHFRFTPTERLEELERLLGSSATGEHVFGLYTGKGLWFLEPRDVSALKALIEEDGSTAWKNLDVTVFHSVVLEKILEVDRTEGNISYLLEPSEAIRLVDEGTHKAAFFLKPTPVEQMMSVAGSGEMMPQKSTYFYPKLSTGLVMNKFEKKAR